MSSHHSVGHIVTCHEGGRIHVPGCAKKAVGVVHVVPSILLGLDRSNEDAIWLGGL